MKEVLTINWPVELILYTHKATGNKAVLNILNKARAKQIKLLEISSVLGGKLADTKTPQGIMAVVDRPNYQLRHIFQNQPSLLVLVDGVQDPGNLGTIIRSADAAGAEGVIVTKGTVNLYNPKIIRTTMGSFFHLPVVVVKTLHEVTDFFTAFNLQLVAGKQKTAQLIDEVNLTHPTVLAVGNEARGLSPEVLKLVHHMVSIPMPGQAESLNAAVAISIMLYETIRQRLRKH